MGRLDLPDKYRDEDLLLRSQAVRHSPHKRESVSSNLTAGIMSKHNKAKLEKDERNKLDALRFKKDRKKKIRHRRADNWCRIAGHPYSCNCVYPSREEVIAASRRH